MILDLDVKEVCIKHIYHRAQDSNYKVILLAGVESINS